MKKVLVVGQGYVGLPIAMRAVAAGYDVVGLETNPSRLARLAAGQSYVEDIEPAAVESALQSGRYRPSNTAEDCANFHIAVITVPTPLKDGVPDLSFVEESARRIAPMLREGATVVLESTTFPGTTREILLPLLEAGSGLRGGYDFFVGYSPERIDPGNPEWSLRNTPKVVSGLDEQSLEKVDEFYRAIVEKTIPVSSLEIAEVTKILENTFRHVNVALVNELAMFSADLGIDIWEAIDAASTKPFGFMRFTPGPGVGGHCLPVDPSYLSWKVKRALGVAFRFVELANDVNDHMPDYVVRRAMAALNRRRKALNGSQILVVGLAYKKNSGDARESPGPVICQRLTAFGADVRAVDGHLAVDDFPRSIREVSLDKSEIDAADLAIVVTDHDDLPWELFWVVVVRYSTLVTVFRPVLRWSICDRWRSVRHRPG